MSPQDRASPVRLSDIGTRQKVLDGARRRSWGPTAVADCRKRFDELMQASIGWGLSSSGFFDIDEWEKEPSPDR
jgi:hypothetical protein